MQCCAVQPVRYQSLQGGAILAPHVGKYHFCEVEFVNGFCCCVCDFLTLPRVTPTDDVPLVSSAIINVAQDLDEPWPLEKCTGAQWQR